MKPFPFAQRSPEWHAWKSLGIGASETGSIAAAMGLLPSPAPWMDTIQDLWEYKTAKRPPKKMHPGLMRGILHEADAIASYKDDTGYDTSPICGEMDNVPYIQASLDGISFDHGIVLETKIPSPEGFALAESGIVPHHYVPSCVHQCLVVWGHPDAWPTAAEHHYYAYQPETNLGHLVVVQADKYKKSAELLLPALSAFWSNVENDIAPCGNAWLQAAIRYRIAAAALEQATALEELAKQSLLDAFPKADVKTYSGGGVTVTKSTKAGSIGYAKYVKDNNVPAADLEKYRGQPSDSVRVTVNAATPVPEISEAVQLAVSIQELQETPKASWHF